MTISLERQVVLARPDEPLQLVIKRMGRGSERIFGITLVVDERMVLQGVVNYGDVLRLLADGVSLEIPVGEVMVRDPITAPVGASDELILKAVRYQLLRRTGGKKDVTRHVPLIDGDRVVRDVVDVFSLLARSPRPGDQVEIYGLGFVGLTLAVALASRGHFVTGIDTNSTLVEQLLTGKPHVFEPRLPDMMQRALYDQQLVFRNVPDAEHHRVVIIAVGTPVEDDGSVSLSALTSVCNTVGQRLKRGDLVMLRSTVPVGTTRSLVRELLETGSGLKAGEDFHLAFTPERTVEGNAMQELSSLPQIVGGFSSRCAEIASAFWQTLTDGVVRVDSLEAAELVKLINNSYRDLSFAFANGVAALADRFNIDAARVIGAANEGYPRDPIPKPSPGVGGYCLTKDPFLYSAVDREADYGLLSLHGRNINRQAGHYPLKVLSRFAERLGRPVSGLSVLVVGIAFKGWPETNDLRGSTGVDVGRELVRQGCEVMGFDAVIDNAAIQDLGIMPVTLDEAAVRCDAVLILNNHPDNVPDGLVANLSGRPTLLFDGWSQLDRHEVERYDGIVYANMGYMTPDRMSTV
ncbi:nucleotide sugar dehydrogenase [Rhodobacterales bacterium HKCCA1058]|nr:nucleotide sugar dehydrogenase [Rhodobacterales bacterium HKCCA1058]